MSDARSEPVEVFVNGEQRQAPQGQSVLDLILSLDIPAERVAVEFNRVILRKELWASTTLQGGEQIEIVHFVGGG
jgi:thiamine biosynthesis protein ThiS